MSVDAQPTPNPDLGNRRSRRLLVAAALVGGIHAAFSLYWALGGDFLLSTVGEWAVEWADRAPLAAGGVLLFVALVKAGGAAAPLLCEAGRLPGSRRAWRCLFAVGAGVLILYGGVNTAAAWIGLATGSASADREALLGHAALWDPLFLGWGLLLSAGLLTSRRRGQIPHAPSDDS